MPSPGRSSERSIEPVSELGMLVSFRIVRRVMFGRRGESGSRRKLEKGHRRETRPCPHCGADVPVGAAACRRCGSDAETGWAEDAGVKGVDLPAGYGGEDEFDYDEFLKTEFGRTREGRRVVPWRRIGVAAIVIVLAALLLLFA